MASAGVDAPEPPAPSRGNPSLRQPWKQDSRSRRRQSHPDARLAPPPAPSIPDRVDPEPAAAALAPDRQPRSADRPPSRNPSPWIIAALSPPLSASPKSRKAAGVAGTEWPRRGSSRFANWFSNGSTPSDTGPLNSKLSTVRIFAASSSVAVESAAVRFSPTNILPAMRDACITKAPAMESTICAWRCCAGARSYTSADATARPVQFKLGSELRFSNGDHGQPLHGGLLRALASERGQMLRKS